MLRDITILFKGRKHVRELYSNWILWLTTLAFIESEETFSLPLNLLVNKIRREGTQFKHSKYKTMFLE